MTPLTASILVNKIHNRGEPLTPEIFEIVGGVSVLPVERLSGTRSPLSAKLQRNTSMQRIEVKLQITPNAYASPIIKNIAVGQHNNKQLNSRNKIPMITSNSFPYFHL